jgi:hypothetical protein
MQIKHESLTVLTNTEIYDYLAHEVGVDTFQLMTQVPTGGIPPWCIVLDVPYRCDEDLGDWETDQPALCQLLTQLNTQGTKYLMVRAGKRA